MAATMNLYSKEPWRHVFAGDLPFSRFVREERNLVAALYAALLDEQNRERFLVVVGETSLDAKAAEVFVEWTYLRDSWDAVSDDDLKRQAILAVLKTSREAELRAASVSQFNRYFRALGESTSAKETVHSPSSWNIKQLVRNFKGDELLNICKLKWAFNVKPDLVLQDGAHVLCVEAKDESSEDTYPSDAAERRLLVEQGVVSSAFPTQTTVQLHLVNEVLGLRGTVKLLSKSGASKIGHGVTWREVVRNLNLDHLPEYARAVLLRSGA